MNLTIISPTQSKNVAIDWLEIQTMRGNLVIQPGHAPSYIVVKPESIAQWLASSGAIEQMYIAHGFVEVSREKVLLISDRQTSTDT